MDDKNNVHFLYIREQLNTVNVKLDKINEQSIINTEAVKSAHTRLNEHEKTIEEHKRVINRGFGAMAVIGIISGGIWSFITKIFI